MFASTSQTSTRVELVGGRLGLAPSLIQCTSYCSHRTVFSKSSGAEVAAAGPSKTSESVESTRTGAAGRMEQAEASRSRGERAGAGLLRLDRSGGVLKLRIRSPIDVHPLG